MKKNFWDASTYSQFLGPRTRPARDLLAVVSKNLSPRVIYDLGCGPGNSTILLKDRWPEAKVIGVDSSDSMLEQARKEYPDMEFIQGDIAEFKTDGGADLIFANASLQWVANHNQVIPRLINDLNPQGILAIQMPNNFHMPAHQTTIKLLQNNPSWRPLLKHLIYGELNQPLYDLRRYHNLLTGSGLMELQLWETEYFQEMPDHQAIFDWSKGTGMRPALTRMGETDQGIFTKAYIEQLTHVFPLQANGKVLFPFRRLFMLGTKGQSA